MVQAPQDKIVQWVGKILRMAWGHKSLANQIKCAIFCFKQNVIQKDVELIYKFQFNDLKLKMRI